jgi:hypothetical protein
MARRATYEPMTLGNMRQYDMFDPDRQFGARLPSTVARKIDNRCESSNPTVSMSIV